MSYNKSKARIEFETTLKELLSLARSISFQKVKLSYDHKNLVYQSTMILLCSAFEEYLRVFVEDLFYRYKVKRAKLSKINQTTRTFSLFSNQRPMFEAFVHTKDETKVLEKLNIKNSYYSIINDSDILTNQIDSNKIVGDRKYPSPKNIKALYNRLGQKDVFYEINTAGNKNYELILRSFLDIRETIAHQESTDLTFNDVKRNFIYINEIINRLDRLSFSLICKTSGISFWN